MRHNDFRRDGESESGATSLPRPRLVEADEASEDSFAFCCRDSGPVVLDHDMGFVAGFQIAVFAFVGIELVGTTAAEAKDPEKNLPKAINSIPIRVLLFYVVALTVIIAVTPWREISADKSPFVAMFTLAGLGIAASVINFVVLTSAASSANSGIYSTSRMVFGLAQEGDALMFSCIFLLASLILLFSGDSVIEAFTVVTTISALLFMFVWTIILASYMVYRKRRPHLHEASKFKMPGGIVMCWVVLAFFVFILWALTTKDDTLQALVVTPIWFVVLGIAWAIIRRRPAHRARYDAFKSELDASRQNGEK